MAVLLQISCLLLVSDWAALRMFRLVKRADFGIHGMHIRHSRCDCFCRSCRCSHHSISADHLASFSTRTRTSTAARRGFRACSCPPRPLWRPASVSSPREFSTCTASVLLPSLLQCSRSQPSIRSRRCQCSQHAGGPACGRRSSLWCSNKHSCSHLWRATGSLCTRLLTGPILCSWTGPCVFLCSSCTCVARSPSVSAHILRTPGVHLWRCSTAQCGVCPSHFGCIDSQRGHGRCFRRCRPVWVSAPGRAC